MRTLAAVVVGFITDIIIGDPDYPFHPVRLIGKMIAGLEKLLRKVFPKSKAGELSAGLIMVVIITAVTYSAGWLAVWITGKISIYLLFALEALISYQCIAVKAMLKESENVLDKVKTGDISSAGQAVKRIVGRDTDKLDMQGVIRADIECVAESLCDGVIAPLFYLMIGGLPLGLAYKAVNTMDSMTGYKNDRYLYFGRAAARLDDIANFIPSRLAAFMIMAGSFFCGRDFKNSFVIWKRDRYKHASPNSAQTEAAMAGALGIRLGGPAYYFGERYEKEYIGDDIKSVEKEDIIGADKIFAVASLLGLIVLGTFRVLILCKLYI